MDYNILFIDEESTQHDQFMDYFEQVCPEIVPQCEFPLATVDEMLQRIEELSPDAVVTDFRLNETVIDYPVVSPRSDRPCIRRNRSSRVCDSPGRSCMT